MLKSLVGTKDFYRRMISLMIPIMVQNGITNFVNMLDNIMIGAIGTAEMTGVGITNQLFFVFMLCIFGALSGAGIFGAQYFGNGDSEGVRYSFRFKLVFCTLLAVGGIALFYFKGESLIELYMRSEEGITDPAATRGFARSYMLIMLIGLIPYTVVQCYSSTLREGGYPTMPMVAGVIAVCVNLVFNYILIFGKFGAPALGVAGAAYATVISRFAELAIVALWTHTHGKAYPFMKGVYSAFRIPMKLAAQFFIKGLPLLVNEALWATGVAVINQCYSIRSLDAVAACNISQTFWNVFSIAQMAVGSAIAILLGQALGANKIDEAKEDSYKMIAFSFVLAVAVGAIYAVAAEFIPMVYNVEQEIRDLATVIMQITALAMPFDALAHASYFTLRSGGKMLITFIFDCGFMWGVSVVLAHVLSNYTLVPFIAIFAAVQSVCIFKGVLGLILVRKGFWAKNIIEK